MTVPAVGTDFLQRIASALTSAGAELIAAASAPGWGPEWAAGWSQVLLMNSPGSPTIYAFRSAEPEHLALFSQALDRLTRGLASSAASSRVPISIVGVAVLDGPITDAVGKKVARIKPSTFYPGLKPSTITVDVAGQRVYAPGLLRKPEGYDLLQRAVRGELIADVLDGVSPAEAGRASAERVQNFYRIIQGRRPVCTYGLIAINVLLFALLNAAGGPDNANALIQFGAMSPHLVESGEWWRLFTVMFVHGSVAHLLFNMTSLFAVGTLAERLYGSIKYLVIYLGSGFAGSILSFLVAVQTGHVNGLYVGASGAIFGIAGALLTVRFQPSDVVPERVRRQISTSMLPLVVFSLLFANVMAANIDNSAHIGGLIAGIALSFALPITRSVSTSA